MPSSSTPDPARFGSAPSQAGTERKKKGPKPPRDRVIAAAERITTALLAELGRRNEPAFRSQVDAERAYFQAAGESLARGREIARLQRRIATLRGRLADHRSLVAYKDALLSRRR